MQGDYVFVAACVGELSVGRPGPARVAIYDVMGREVIRLPDTPSGESSGRMVWDGTNGRGDRVKPGIYFVRVETGGSSVARKLVLLP